MAHTSPVFIPHKNIKHIEYLNDRQEQQKYAHETFETNLGSPHFHNNDAPMSNVPSERKCQVYVHQYTRLPSHSLNNMEHGWRCGSEIHQTMYRHEFSDYFAKVNSTKQHYDNLSLNSRLIPTNNSPNRMTKSHNTHHKHVSPGRMEYNNRAKMPQVKSTPTARINKSFLFSPENKAVMDKLEESYWSKWKPNKATPPNNVYHKTKGLYTENEQISESYQFVTDEEKNERGDSSETITPHLSTTKHQPSEEDVTPSSQLCSQLNSDLQNLNISDTTINGDQNNLEPLHMEPEEISISLKTQSGGSEVAKESQIETVPIIMSKTDSLADVTPLKHTDSFILTCKKQNEEKPHYQQPKCIKLFKNLDYTSTAKTNFIKGGTYPLKSCLKRSSTEHKPSALGPPGGCLKVVTSTTRKPGKANRFTT